MSVNSSWLRQRAVWLAAAVVVVAAIVIVGIVAVVHNGSKRHATDSGMTQTTTSQPETTTAGALSNDSLQYEKLHFSYPSNWTESGKSTTSQTVTPGTDGATIASPDGLAVTIRTGVNGAANSLGNVLGSVPITTLGGQFYFDFYNANTTVTGLAQGACVVDSPNAGAAYPLSKNISAISGGSAPYNQICITYPESENGEPMVGSIASIKSDPAYADALKVIQSISY